MILGLKLIPPFLIATAMPSVARPEFCGIAGETAKEIAANVLNREDSGDRKSVV